MPTIDEVMAMLNDISDEIPDAFYRELNGGVILLPEAKTHPESSAKDDLLILGEYHHDRPGLGRYITIYYGSFIRLYAHLNPSMQKEKLREVLLHEFTHHIESLAGERGLELKDAREMEMYHRGARRYRIKRK
jgi:predicted Zn-dependent protease with MMP-like domain